MNSIFIHHRIVRFGECDPAGVVYYPVFFNWFHECMEAWFEQGLLHSYSKTIQEIGFPAKSCQASFFRPIQMGMHISVALTISELRSKSFALQFQIYQEHLNETSILTNTELVGTQLAEGQVVCVGIGVQKGEFQFRPMPIPSFLHSKMKDYVQSSTTERA